jgi:hypothetical protein
MERSRGLGWAGHLTVLYCFMPRNVVLNTVPAGTSVTFFYVFVCVCLYCIIHFCFNILFPCGSVMCEKHCWCSADGVKILYGVAASSEICRFCLVRIE